MLTLNSNYCLYPSWFRKHSNYCLYPSWFRIVVWIRIWFRIRYPFFLGMGVLITLWSWFRVQTKCDITRRSYGIAICKSKNGKNGFDKEISTPPVASPLTREYAPPAPHPPPPPAPPPPPPQVPAHPAFIILTFYVIVRHFLRYQRPDVRPSLETLKCFQSFSGRKTTAS